jgi:hypothetical protein
MAELDGIFKVVGTLKASTGSIKGNFDARVRAMAESVFGLEVAGKTTAELVSEIEAAFDMQIEANISGDIRVNYQPTKCSANIDVAVSAQAQCEAKAGCDVEVECDFGKMSFECSGKCEGGCEGTCDVPTCTVTLEADVKCEGICQASCTSEVDGSAGCDGKCEGECSGECSAYNGSGQCAGACDGTCNGSCTVEGSAAAECDGTCNGKCKMEGTAEGDCEGKFGCSGECSGECSGSCEGEIKAPKCGENAECDASADCEAQASAQASASLECTPPSLELDVVFAGGMSADARAVFLAKLDKFEVKMIGIIQGMAELRALVDPEYAAGLGIEPPTATIGAAVEAFTNKLVSGEFEVEAPGLVVCAVPAFHEAAGILGSISGEMRATIELQLRMVALLDIT